MNVVHKIRIFLSYKRDMQFLLLEAFYFLAYGRMFKSLPFSKMSKKLGNQMDETSFERHMDQAILKNVSNAIHIMSRFTFWESQCLVKAIAGMKMLERRNIESTLYLGTAKDDKGQFIAHAWLRSGPFYLTGAEEMERFIVVGKFAKKTKSRMREYDESHI